MSTIVTPTAGPAPAGAGSARLMRWVLVDAAVSGPAGLALLAGAALLDETLGVPASVLAATGAFFLVYTTALLLLARAGAPATAVAVVAAGNLCWAALSAVVIAADPLTMTTAGHAVTALQGALVALLAVLQIAAVRDARGG
jgi:hypothetical protein